jgi:hypothetical protein
MNFNKILLKRYTRLTTGEFKVANILDISTSLLGRSAICKISLGLKTLPPK